MKRHISLGLLLIASLLTVPASLGATTGEMSNTVLSADGKIWRLQGGRYGDLFPGSHQVASDHLVLALDEVGPDGIGKRWLVPETSAIEGEYSPGLIYEESTQALYLIWESPLPNAYSRLLLVSFQAEQWSEIIEITGNPFSRKGSPQLRVTRDAAPEPTDLEATRHSTTVVHLVWWEEFGGGKVKRYAPIVIQDGSYIGWTSVYDLGSFLPEAPPASAVTPEIEEVLTLQRGIDGSSMVVGFFDPHANRLASVEIQALPFELADLAEQIREYVISLYEQQPTLTVSELAEKARAQIIHIGAKFHAAFLQFLSEEIARVIVAEAANLSPDNVSAIADKARAQIIHIGAKLKAGGLEGGEQWSLLELGQSPSGGAPYQLLKVAPVGLWEPASAGEGARLIVSESGHFALLGWEGDDRVFYRESLADGSWTDTQQILLTQTLDLDAAFVMLGNRVKSR